MRGKFFYISILMICVISLASCTRVINCPADELRMHAWRATSDNGNTADLRFEGSKGILSIHTGDSALDLSGLCVMTDDRMILCDAATGMHYTFGYTVYGDRVELSCYDGTVSLKKAE